VISFAFDRENARNCCARGDLIAIMSAGRLRAFVMASNYNFTSAACRSAGGAATRVAFDSRNGKHGRISSTAKSIHRW